MTTRTTGTIWLFGQRFYVALVRWRCCRDHNHSTVYVNGVDTRMN